MCARYFITSPTAEIVTLFGVAERPNLVARFNIAPTQHVPVVLTDRDGRHRLSMARWGLIPAWASGPSKVPLYNARGETVADKPSFRDAFAEGRCLIPANGFFDWRTGPGSIKQPYRFGLADGALFAFGGIASRWRDAEGTTLLTCAIVTTLANEVVAPVCHRMPVMLADGDHRQWLASPEAAAPLMRPFPNAPMVATPVSRRVGDVRQDDPGLIEPVPAHEAPSQASLF